MGLERKFVYDLWKISSEIPEVHNRFGKILGFSFFFFGRYLGWEPKTGVGSGEFKLGMGTGFCVYTQILKKTLLGERHNLSTKQPNGTLGSVNSCLYS